jgi:hypothetical protein
MGYDFNRACDVDDASTWILLCWFGEKEESCFHSHTMLDNIRGNKRGLGFVGLQLGFWTKRGRSYWQLEPGWSQ